MILWIAQLQMSRGNKVVGTSEVDGTTKQTTYKWDSKTRKRIDSINGSATSKAFRKSFVYYGLHLVNDKQKEEIMKVAEDTDMTLKKIDPLMFAKATFVPLETDAFVSLGTYNKMANLLHKQILETILKRLDKMDEEPVSDRMKNSLIRYVEKLIPMNILQEKDLNNVIRGLCNELETASVSDIKKEIEIAINKITEDGELK